MKIVLSGIETNNKGAELMLYAILQEIERTFPGAEVFVPLYSVRQGLDYLITNVDLKDKPYAAFKRKCNSLHVTGILRRLHLPYAFFLDSWPVHGVDYFLDASGFHFSDQWEIPISSWETQLSGYKKQNTKIVFLPQAFGPVSKAETKTALKILDRYADIIMPRDRVSYDYLTEVGLDKKKIKCYKDFTSLVNGLFPEEYDYLKNGVCIIPNIRMFDKGNLDINKYVHFVNHIIKESEKRNLKVFLLNHEGIVDEELAYKISNMAIERITVVTGLNALEVKGLISQSYVCVTSRFHGAVSALNSSVPCLATSWSHKYEELFIDFGLSDFVLDLKQQDQCVSKFNELLNESYNSDIRNRLSEEALKVKIENRRMWNCVWNENTDCL